MPCHRVHTSNKKTEKPYRSFAIQHVHALFFLQQTGEREKNMGDTGLQWFGIQYSNGLVWFGKKKKSIHEVTRQKYLWSRGLSYSISVTCTLSW